MERRSAFGLAGLVTAAVIGIGGVALASQGGGGDPGQASATQSAAAVAGDAPSGYAPDVAAAPSHATTRSS